MVVCLQSPVYVRFNRINSSLQQLSMTRHTEIYQCIFTYIQRPSRKKRTFADTVCTAVLLQPIIGFWCSVCCRKLPHVVVHRILSCGKCRESCGHGRAYWESHRLWDVIWFLLADEILGYLTEDASSPVELFCCTTMHVCTLPGRHKPCCRSNSIGTSSNILRTVWTWHRLTFSFFKKWRSTLLVNASQMMEIWRTLVE